MPRRRGRQARSRDGALPQNGAGVGRSEVHSVIDLFRPEATGKRPQSDSDATRTRQAKPARSDRRRSEKTERRKDDRAHEPEKKNKNAEDAAATPDGRTENGKLRVRRGRGGAKKEKEKEKAADDADA